VASGPVLIVVEDDQDMRHALERVLAEAGFDIRSYGSGEEFFAAGAAAGAACLVVDIRLPGISGFDLLRRLGADDTRPPAVLISALDDRTTRHRALDVGAAAFLAKPFLGTDLIQAIRTAIASAL